MHHEHFNTREHLVLSPIDWVYSIQILCIDGKQNKLQKDFRKKCAQGGKYFQNWIKMEINDFQSKILSKIFFGSVVRFAKTFLKP